MDKPVIHLNARDFDPIRIVCHHSGCGAVVEIRLKQVEATMKAKNGCCSVCGKPFTNPKVEGGADMISQLARVLLALNELPEQVRIEVPIVAS